MFIFWIVSIPPWSPEGGYTFGKDPLLISCNRKHNIISDWFDAWLNEGIGFLSIIKSDIVDLANAQTIEKYYGIIKSLNGTIAANNDLDLLIKLRDEMVHYLPRISPAATGPRKNIPQEFWVLDKRGLFLIPTSESVEIAWGAQICSYHLAYWAWETIDMAASNFINAFDSTMKPEFKFIYQAGSAVISNFIRKSYLLIPLMRMMPNRALNYPSSRNRVVVFYRLLLAYPIYTCNMCSTFISSYMVGEIISGLHNRIEMIKWKK